MEKRKIYLMAILSVIIYSVMLPSSLHIKPMIASSDRDYMTVEGVLENDYYALYPFEKHSLKIGFSKFGEMIDSSTNVGLEYDNVDPFATPPGPGTTPDVPKKYWINGWYINITYFHRELNEWRTVWAGALFADINAYATPNELWLHVDSDTNKDGIENFLDKGFIVNPDRTIDFSQGPFRGGRKTNGTAVTMPITIIYNGSRRFVALLNTTLYDHLDDNETSNDVPLVRIYITIIFNKVKKQVILLKDVKSLLPWKVGDKLRIQFSNRGEVDLGNPECGYTTYEHFWTAHKREGQKTVYNSHWELGTTDDLGNEEPWFSLATDPTLHSGEPTSSGTFDVAQVINPDCGKVFYAAFWPSLSDWEMNGFPMWWRSLDSGDPHSTDLSPEGPSASQVPFYIGEWDFVLDNTKGDRLQFRGVTVYGIVEKDEADDADMGSGHSNVLEDEAINFQLKEVFNPWDLNTAINPDRNEKNVGRNVLIKTGDGKKTEFKLPKEMFYGPTNYTEVPWNEYCVFAERVLVDGKLCVRNVNYTLKDTNGNNLYDTISFTKAPKDGSRIKILWSGPPHSARYEWIIVGIDRSDSDPGARTPDVIAASMVAAAIKNKGFELNLTGLDRKERYGGRIPFVLSTFGKSGDIWTDYMDNMDYMRSALKDDYCEEYPISSSNIITVGGPLANLLTAYFNEFTDAFFVWGVSDYFGVNMDRTEVADYKNKILALTCWSKNAYKDSASKGYAVIATYKDINGTVGLIIWGLKAEDGYWAAKWLDDNIHDMQKWKDGITAIILKIDYSKCIPKVTIVEVLGTISETNFEKEQQPWHPDP